MKTFILVLRDGTSYNLGRGLGAVENRIRILGPHLAFDVGCGPFEEDKFTKARGVVSVYMTGNPAHNKMRYAEAMRKGTQLKADAIEIFGEWEV